MLVSMSAPSGGRELDADPIRDQAGGEIGGTS